MLVLRVRCVDDGREVLLERHGADAHQIQVVELKKLILQQRCCLTHHVDASSQWNPPPLDLEQCFVLLRGQILADPDVVDLNALRVSDFFVFATDAPQNEVFLSSSNEMHSGDAIFEVLQSQLVEMGFSKELAAQALQQSSNKLSESVTLLTEGKVHLSSGGKMQPGTISHMSIRPLESLVHDANVTKLRELAAKDSFQALLLLRDHFSSEMLNKFNENPVATLRLLLLPVRAQREGLFDDDVIDLDSDNGASTTEDSDTAIDRLMALGFSRDLVELMYESCGGNEELTADALLQTLE